MTTTALRDTIARVRAARELRTGGSVVVGLGDLDVLLEAAAGHSVGPFDGKTYDPAQDRPRLTMQLFRVRRLMQDGQWRTLGAIAKQVGASEASVSARLRDLRKPKFGALVVDRRRVAGANGLWEYRVAPPPPPQPLRMPPPPPPPKS